MRTLVIAILLYALPSISQAQYRTKASLGSELNRSAPALSIPGSSPLLRHLSVDCDVDRTMGREAASNTHSSSGWMVGGLVSGVFLGLIGTAVMYAVASSSTAQAERIPDNVEATCYRDGYSSKAKSMNTNNALIGGLLGTAALVLIVVSATSGSSY